MATADNGELMALSGFINPYPGQLGVVQEGAIADPCWSRTTRSKTSRS